jgi:hypothetical protein
MRRGGKGWRKGWKKGKEYERRDGKMEKENGGKGEEDN